MIKGRNFPYVEISNVSNLYLDYFLVNSIPRKLLEKYLKGDSELTKKIGLSGFRLNSIDDNRLKMAFVRHMHKDMELYSHIYDLWTTAFEEELADYDDLDKHEFITKIPSLITSIDIPNIINYIRVNKEELLEAAAPLLKEWHSMDTGEKEIAEKLEFSYDGEIFSEIYGFDPFLDVDIDLFEELEIEDADEEDFAQEEGELSEEKALAKQIMDLPVDKSLSAVLISLGALKNKLARAEDFENLYKSTIEDLKILSQDFESLKKEASESKTKLKEKEAAFDSSQKKINSYDKKVNELNQKIVSINSENGRLGAEVGSLRKELAAAKEKLAKADKQAGESKVLLEKKIKEVEKETENKLRKEMNKMREKYEEQLAAKDYEINKLQLSANSTQPLNTIGDVMPDFKNLFEEDTKDKNNIGSITLINEDTAKKENDDFDWFDEIVEFKPD